MSWFYKKILCPLFKLLNIKDKHCNPTPPPPPPIPSFDHFVTEPKDMIGYGMDYSWMWVDPDAFGDTMVNAGVTMTHIEVYGCAVNKDANESSHGYWCDRFDEVKPYMTKFLDAMKVRKITTQVTICGWNFQNGCPDPDNHNKPSTICSKRFNDGWFMNVVNFLVARGTDGLVILATAESFDARNRECDAKAGHFDDLLAANWSGMKSWNRGSRPKKAPAGYFLEYHPLKQKDQCVPGCIVLTDTSMGKEFDKPDGTIDPDKVTPYVRDTHNRGQAFIYYGHSFMAWNIDAEGIRAIGSACK